MNRKATISAILALAMSTGMTVTVSAYNPMAEMEDISRKAVATAISEGTIPADATIFDCAYSKDESGKTVVVQYRDDNGVWVDVTTGNTVAQEALLAPITTELTEDTLAEYADEVFRLTNEAREEAGLPPLERTDELDGAADIRAGECASLNSLYVGGKAYLRPDGSKFSSVLTEMGIDWSGAGENSAYGHLSPEAVMNAWLGSSGHRANMLKDDRSQIGIGVRKAADGTLYWIQLFV